MALEGQLSDFRLEEILQLISVQQKSGFLVLNLDQEMVFYFDRGVLISTRDRRHPGNDPLERYLRRYGFLNAEQWAHVDYVLAHSSLDLAEVLVSEHLLDERALTGVLQAVAQEMIHEGMKLKRGTYHFTATHDVNAGIRGRVALDIQGLLMEGARRQDEEPRLLERFPSPSQSFAPGAKPPRAGEVGETGARVLKLALAGETLDQIIAKAQASAFTVRELLAGFCDAGALAPVAEQPAAVIPLPLGGETQARRRCLDLRRPVLTAALALSLLGVGAARWRMLPPGPLPLAPADADSVAGAGLLGDVQPPSASLDQAAVTPEQLRLNQLHADVEQAIRLFRYQHGKYPAELSLLVKAGFLPASRVAILEARGWRYALRDQGRAFLLEP